MIDEPRTGRAFSRRRALGIGVTGVGAVLTACHTSGTGAPARPPARPAFSGLEVRFGARIGAAAIDTGSRRAFGYRSEERFLMHSTVKVPLVAAVLSHAVAEPGLLDRTLHWAPGEVLDHAPVTGPATSGGLTVAQLCEAALTSSDNTAANVLSTRIVGGPSGVTAVFRSLGDTVSRADRLEPDLNDPAPGDPDTTTPAAFAESLRALTLGVAVPPPQRDRLVGWMLANTTGAGEIRAATPPGWAVADKTGSGFAGQANDVAVVFPPGRAPIVLAVCVVPNDPRSTSGKPAVAATARELLHGVGLAV